MGTLASDSAAIAATGGPIENSSPPRACAENNSSSPILMPSVPSTAVPSPTTAFVIGHALGVAVSSAALAPNSGLAPVPTLPLSSETPRIEPSERHAHLDDTAHMFSVYALNDSAGSPSALSTSLRLDLSELMALGHSPTRQRLSDEEVAELPRVRFETPELQRCSICLEAFKHGMLLTTPQ